MKEVKEVIAGVPLAQFAAVTAALAEAFPLRAVLVVEGIDAKQWAEADRGWTAELDKDPSLLARYEAELSTARERLLARDDTPDGDKAKARAGKAKLVRSGAGLSTVLAMSNAAAGSSDPALPPPMMPSGLAAPPPPIHMVPTAPPVMSAPEPPQVLAPLPPMVIDAPREAPRRSVDDHFTMVGMEIPSALLPFRAALEDPASAAGTSGVLPAPSPPKPAPPPRPRDPEDRGTLTDFKLPETVLPFRNLEGSLEAAPPSPVLSPAPSAAPSPVLSPVPSAAPSPAPSAAPSPAPPVTSPVVSPPRARGGDTWIEEERLETVAVRLSKGAVLPFKSAPSQPPPPAAPPAYDSYAPPPAERAAWTRAAPPLAALEPEEYSAGEWGAAPTAAPTIMGLEQHASLCLEIALDPGRAAEAMARYQVSEADKARADEFYRARIAVDPELGAQWHHAYTSYHAWLTSRSRT